MKSQTITITITAEQVWRSVLKMCDERIARLEIAIPICKHSKRKHQSQKMLNIFRKIRETTVNSLQKYEE